MHRERTIRSTASNQVSAGPSGGYNSTKGWEMTLLRAWYVGAALAVVAVGSIPPSATAQGVREYVRSWMSEPPTLEDVARRIDHIQNCLSDQGTVVIKQPDVWSQARMTKFRKEYENTMAQQLSQFKLITSARIARSDSASFNSQTALAGALSPLQPGQSLQVSSSDLSKELSAANGMLGSNLPGQASPPFGAAADFALLNPTAPKGAISPASPPGNLTYGLEPNVQNDEQGDYITHLQRLRRINLGDDNADSAGYGLYLMRVPVSITPGDCTKKGFGAVVNMSVSHDFGPKFLQSTYRNLVINDLIDQLSPVVYEMIRSGLADEHQKALEAYYKPDRRRKPAPANGHSSAAQADPATQKIRDRGTHKIAHIFAARTVNRGEPRVYPLAPSDFNRVFGGMFNILLLSYATQEALDLVASPASSMPNIDFNRVHLTDVRSYLKQELGAAYDLMDGHCTQDAQPVLADVPYIEDLIDKVFCRKYEGPKGARPNTLEEFSDFVPMYEGLTQRLPGNLHDRPIGVLCWAIAIDAGLLSRQLHEDMSQTKGPDGWTCPPEAEQMAFYNPVPLPDASQVFEGYVKARWPMITFALEPVIDEQNVDDAFTRRRDLQLALSFALASGRISFRQAITYTRALQYESQTIALNQTVAAFAHGNDTFGWRIAPRYQTPPEESNLQAVTNLLLRGGPGPNYQLAHSKIEPGLRELTAVVVMPSFVRGVRLDVANDWYRVIDPDELKVHTAHAIELGRKINEARDCLDAACKCGRYRTEDVQRLQARLHQLEQLLPLQTQFVKVPYENTLGGFDLFTPGASALVPQLTGFFGVDYIDVSSSSNGCDLIVYGKHYNIYETHVNVGGHDLPAEGTAVAVAKDPSGNPIYDANSGTPLRDDKGNLLLQKPDGTTYAFTDNGSFDIISREVMRVRIPSSLAKQLSTVTRADDGSRWVEISVSTPNGISNRLQVPVSQAKPATASPQPPGYTIPASSTSVTLAYYLPPANNPANPTARAVCMNYKDKNTPDAIPIGLAAPALVDPSPVDVTFDFDVASGGQLTPATVTVPNVAFNSSKMNYPVDTSVLATKLQTVASVLYSFYSPSSTSLPSVKTTKITVTASTNPPANHTGTDKVPLPGVVMLAGTTDNQLTINFKYYPGDPPAGGAASGQVGGSGQASPAPEAVPDPQLPQARTNTRPTPMPLPPGMSQSGGLNRPMASLPAPPTSTRRDDQTLKTAFQTQSPTPGPVAFSVPVNPLGVSGNLTSLTLANLAGNMNLGNAAGLPGLPPQTAALVNDLAARKAGIPPVVVVPPRAPTVNVQVPVNNMMNPKAEHFSLFHRRNKQNATPQNPTRPSLMERLRGNP